MEQGGLGRGTLYVVATPLGNLDDLSPRARQTLQQVDLVACEDTRRTGKLLSRLDIKTDLISYHEHNEVSRAALLLERLEQGIEVALVSDAGTPLVSDPGYRLVRACRAKGVPVKPVPGPAAAIAALSISGLPTDRFLFAGFLPSKSSRSWAWLTQVPATVIFYLSPHRLGKELARLKSLFGSRQAFLVREMTKLHETVYCGDLTSIAEQVSGARPRGEYTLVLEGSRGARLDRLNLRAYVTGLEVVAGLDRKTAIKQVAREVGLPKSDLYRKLMK